MLLAVAIVVSLVLGFLLGHKLAYNALFARIDEMLAPSDREEFVRRMFPDLRRK